ncbi:MAG: glycoside hydrolase family 3 C-terminal domain-containing protein [Planctomycetota bacterium]|nr:glycoside hydrolase family 3 C-terminal domain-containing protein [Planctomycetota bacterium]
MKRTLLLALVTFLVPMPAAASASEWVRIDDFQANQPDVLPPSGNGWTVADKAVSQAVVAADRLAPGNQAVKLQRLLNVKSDQDDTLFHSGAVNIPPGGKGTVFLRFLIESGLDTTLGSTTGEKPVQNISLKIGLTEAALNAGNCRAGIWINGRDAMAYGLPSGPSKDSVPVRRNRWYRLWLVVDNAEGATDRSAAYLQEEGVAGKPTPIPGLILVPAKSARGILATVGVVKARECGLTDIWLDDLFVDNTGENLSDPTTSTAAIGWKQKLESEAKQYRHLLKKAATPREAEQQARQLLAAMTREEKFALVCGDGAIGIPGFPRLGIPPVVFSDASAGINNGPAPVKNRHPQTVAYPCLLLLAATWDPQLAEEYARAIGEECRSGGTHVLLGPSVNFYRTAVCGRNWEYPGEDPHLAGRMTAAYVRGLQSTGTAATLKVLVGNEIEFHRRGSNSQIDERTLQEIYLEPFRAGIAAGALAVMTAYNQLNGAWCGQDQYVGTTLLREQLGFQWISMTDWIGTYDGVKVAESGTDLEMPGGWALKQDRAKVIGSAAIDRMVLNVLKTCIYAGFYEPNYTRPELLERRPQWEQTALNVNRAGIVLLQNNGLLPLAAAQTGKTILLAGNNAAREELAGGGSGHVRGYNLKTYLQAVTETFPDAKVVHAEKPTDDQIRAADLVLLFPGFPLTGKGHEGEGSDRDSSFALPDDAIISRCVALNSRTIVCVTAGGGVQMDWADKAAAIVHCLYGGQTGPAALMDILTGKANPGGKLPFTIERQFADSPSSDVITPKPDTDRPYPASEFPDWVKGDFYANADKTQFYPYDVRYREGVFIGHRWYESKNLPVRFPFGFGLSYTTFGYEKLEIEPVKDQTVRVSFTVKNTGPRPGAEVAELYVSPHQSSVPRPPQELKTFQNVHLQFGESKRVEIQLGPEAFRFWHPAKKAWAIELGEFEIRIGASSGDIRLRATVTL